MHELSLLANLMKKIESILVEERAEKVVGVRVKLGALAHISPSHFTEHFVHAAVGTPAEGSRLSIETSEEISDPHAQDILLLSIEVEN